MGAESMWACLPAGPLERHFVEGIQGGVKVQVLKHLKVWLPSWKGFVSGKPLLVK
jgi:hypothetical protein